VDRFAGLTCRLPDHALDIDWAWHAYDSEGVRFAFFRTYEDLCELAARSAADRGKRGPALTEAQSILAQYHVAYRDLRAALLNVDAQTAAREPAPGEWTLQQVVKHSVGADLGFYGVVKYALERHRMADGKPLEIPEDAWEALLGADEASVDAALDGPWDDLLNYFDSVHARALTEFCDVGDDELDAPSRYWEGLKLSLRFRLHRFHSHLRQHTVQVDKTLAGIGCPPAESLRLLRLIYGALADAEGAVIGDERPPGAEWADAAESIEERTVEIAAVLEGI
jgi:hypothetical protein